VKLMSIGKNLQFVLTLASIVYVGPSSLFAQQSYCPQSISVKQTLANIPEGWTAGHDDMPNRWEGATFYSGPPEEKASLVYDRWTKSSGTESGIWHFARNSSPAIWLSCRYSFTNITLAKQLSPDTTECTMTYTARTSSLEPLEIQKIACH
jgi:hypothetical protein